MLAVEYRNAMRGLPGARAAHKLDAATHRSDEARLLEQSFLGFGYGC